MLIHTSESWQATTVAVISFAAISIARFGPLITPIRDLGSSSSRTLLISLNVFASIPFAVLITLISSLINCFTSLATSLYALLGTEKNITSAS